MKWLLLLLVTIVCSLSASAQNVDSAPAGRSDSVHIRYPDGTTVVLSPSARRRRPAPTESSDEKKSVEAEQKDSMDITLDEAMKKSAEESSKDVAEAQKKAARQKRDWTTWRPNPKRALWMALVIPGGGQIYNRKYWKLPIFYGGFVGCIYAITWNNQMYHDYAQAYMDIMDSNPETKSYEQFLHFNTQITEQNKSRYQELFRKRKNRYRRWRDLASFVTMAVYAVSVIDAYVDASLSDFDISRDLSLHIAPRVLSNGQSVNPLQSSALGIGAALKF